MPESPSVASSIAVISRTSRFGLETSVRDVTTSRQAPATETDSPVPRAKRSSNRSRADVWTTSSRLSWRSSQMPARATSHTSQPERTARVASRWSEGGSLRNAAIATAPTAPAARATRPARCRSCHRLCAQPEASPEQRCIAVLANRLMSSRHSPCESLIQPSAGQATRDKCGQPKKILHDP